MCRFRSKLIVSIALFVVVVYVSGFRSGYCEIRNKGQFHYFRCNLTKLHAVNEFLEKWIQKYRPFLEINMTLSDIWFPYPTYIDDQITQIQPVMEKNWFRPKVLVRYLRLEALKLDLIGRNAFNAKQFSNLTILRLVRIPIKILHNDVFNGLTELKQLWLDSVQIVTFEEKLFVPLKKLEVFQMRNCRKSQLSLNSLFGTTDLNLSRVLVTGCNLTTSIKRITFSGLKKIKELKLASNQIAKIEVHSFDIVMGTLTNLDLRRNRLTTLLGDLFQRPVRQVISIQLDDNPWHCDIRLNRLMQLSKHSDNLQFDSIKCKTPKEFAGRKLKYLTSLDAVDQGISPFEEPVSTSKPASSLTFDEVSPTDPWNTDESPWETMANSSIDEWHCNAEHGRNEDIKLKCQQSDRIISLTKPSTQIENLLQMHDGEIVFNTNTLTNDLQLIATIHQQLKPNGIVKCASIKINNAIKNDGIGSKLQPNQLYQFCIMEKLQITITPLNCRSFLLIQKENEPKNDDSESDAWIWKSNQTTLTIAFVLSGVYAFVIGLYISIGLVKLFPALKSSKC